MTDLISGIPRIPHIHGPRQMFLLDGIGAVLSAFFLGVVLVSLEDLIGMPPEVLYALSALACGFAVYSLTCWMASKLFPLRTWHRYLAVIAIMNFLYCLLTLGLVVFHYGNLTALGLLYFLGEILVIGGVILMEMQVIARQSRQIDLRRIS